MNELKEKNKNAIINYPDIEKDVPKDNTPIEFVTQKPQTWKRKAIIISVSIVSLLIIVLFSIVFINLQSNKIFGNVYIDGIKVGNLSKEDAIEKINKEKELISSYKINITCENISIQISGSEIDGTSKVEDAVEKAYSIGRYGNIITNNTNMIKSIFSQTDISSEYVYNNEKLDSVVASITSQLPQLEQSGYTIDGNNLIIKKGSTGVAFNNEEVKNEIILAIQKGSQEDVEIKGEPVSPEELDIETIRNEIYKEAKDATYKKEPFEIVPHQDGVDFAISIEEAEKLLVDSENECIIPLKYTKPNITTDHIGTEAFPDLLSSFQTTYIQSKVNRTSNLKLASNAINGVVIMPGETFSYNKTLGPRTAARGYKMAGVYSGGEVVDGLGGGICQISSNLYNIVLLANLGIVERHNHQFLPGYVGAGKDATVVYGALDFKFKNTRNYPVKIVSSVGNGYVQMKLYGVKEANDYEVVISTTVLSTVYPKTVYEDTSTLAEGATKVKDSGQNGCKSVTYKILKKDGKEVSREKLSSDTYSAMKKVILRGTKKTSSNTNNNNTSTNNNTNTNTGNNNTDNNTSDGNTNTDTNNNAGENTNTDTESGNSSDSQDNVGNNDIIIDV